MRLNGRDSPTHTTAALYASVGSAIQPPASTKMDEDREHYGDCTAQVRPMPLLTAMANDAKVLHNEMGNQIGRLEAFAQRLLGDGNPAGRDDPSSIGEAVGYSEVQQLSMLSASSRQFLGRLHALAERLDEAA